MKIEMHLIQNFVPSCLNRDDTNTPKDCEFGGVRRARISSQCLKRAVRKNFGQTGSVQIGTRTKRLKQRLTAILAEQHQSDESLSRALDVFIETYYSKPDSKRPDETAVLLYLGEPEIAEAAKAADALWLDLVAVAEQRRQAREKAAKETAKAGKGKKEEPPALKLDREIANKLRSANLSADIALFGRMLAEQAEMRVDAACQVAHALSTHRADLDMDFYTAVDDLNTTAETGAGMLGVTGFNSACFYRYALVDRPQLIKSLKSETVADDVIRAFLLASIYAIPTGKQNSMAAQNLPSFGMMVVRGHGAPCSLANAFARPVQIDLGRDEDIVGRSIEALCRHWTQMQKVYGVDGVLATPLFTLDHEDRLGSLAGANAGSVEDTIRRTMAAVQSGGGAA